MRRRQSTRLATLPAILMVLTLVVGATLLAGCSSGCRECPTMCDPTGPHEYVVDQRCFPIDRYGRPLGARAP